MGRVGRGRGSQAMPMVPSEPDSGVSPWSEMALLHTRTDPGIFTWFRTVHS